MSMMMGCKRTTKRKQTSIGWLRDKWLARREAEKCLDCSPIELDRSPRQTKTILKAWCWAS